MIEHSNNQNRALFSVFSLMIMGQISLDIYLPAMPIMTTFFHTDPMLMQLSITCMLFSFAFCQLVVGVLVDRFGKRVIVLMALILLAISNMLCALTHSIVFFLLLRVFTGVGAGCCNVIARTLLVGNFKGEALRRYSSYLYLSWALVPMLAPLLGGYMVHYANWQTIFIFLSLISLCYSFVIYKCFEEKVFIANEVNFTVGLKKYVILMQGDHKYFMHLLVCVVLSYATLITIIQALPFYLADAHQYSSVDIARVLLIIGLATILGVFINLRLLRRSRATVVIYSGLFIMLFSSLVMLKHHQNLGHVFSLAILVAWFFMLRIGVSLVLPNCQAMAMSTQREMAGYASALLGFFTYFGTVVISYAVSHLPHNNIWPLLATLLVESVMCMMVYLLRPSECEDSLT